MRSISLSLMLFGAAAALASTAVVGCDNPLALSPPTDSNFVDTVTLFALRGTGLPQPSAYDIVNRTVAHTDRLEAFDFAFDLSDAGTAEIYPTGALNLGNSPGIAVVTMAFDSVLSAPLTGFVTDSVVPVSVGTVFVGKSRPNGLNCALAGTLPRYGKFRVLTIDTAVRSITLETLVDANCGYRGLEPGLPGS
jgi:hypothetical protein